MNIIAAINRKKRGEKLLYEEVNSIISAYYNGEIPDYQMSALLMAIYFRGMDDEEMAALTLALVNTGERIDLSGVAGYKIDKHSTGGVGDKTTLIAIPLAASSGVKVAKMAGRGLGHTGGTIDKLESIKGFKTALTRLEFIANLQSYGMAISGQTDRLTPGDRKIYALRDVTATVDSIPLIASSIMSKKIAAGANGVVLDVKCGSGAFMKTLGESRKLAEAMTGIARIAGIRAVAVITDMNQPLGMEAGNANEVMEAIDVLKGQGPGDITKIALEMASQMAVMGGAYENIDEARKELAKKLKTGEALEKFRQLIKAQHGEEKTVDDPHRYLPEAARHIDVRANESGYVTGMDTEASGYAAVYAGAGRLKKEDMVDHAAGITLYRKTGDRVQAGDVLCTIHTGRDGADTDAAVRYAEAAFMIGRDKPTAGKLIYETIV